MNLVEESLTILKNFYDERKRNLIAFSAGKDSIVLYHLAKRTGIPFEYVYGNTTIDPPGLIGLIRREYSDVNIIQPKRTFYELIVAKGLPTRTKRFCCSDLKEYIGIDCKVFEGIRKGESIKRDIRLRTLIEPEVCDTRRKGKIHVYPIMNWAVSDIWNYIREYNLKYPAQYDIGWDRIGCVGCPLAQQKKRILQFQTYPKYAYAIIKAIEKNMEVHPGKYLSNLFSDPYEAFFWWISELTIDQFRRSKDAFFIRDFKKEMFKLFPLNKK